MKLLIIEDEKLLADSLKILFQSKGVETDVVYDGENGEQYAMLNIYDLIILDIMLPIKNGYQVAKSIREKHNSTPILMLTARSDDMPEDHTLKDAIRRYKALLGLTDASWAKE